MTTPSQIDVSTLREGETKAAGVALRVAPFTWRDHQGRKHAPKDMETRHLFFTLRMIWNHRMPAEARIEPYKRWELRYPDAYLAEAVTELMRELSTRKNVRGSWQADLLHMQEWLARRRVRVTDQSQRCVCGA